MARVSPGDEARLQAMLRQLFQSVKERITGAPSLECAEEVLLRLEETDDNFHNYEFVKYLRQHICNTLGSMIEEEMEKCMSDQNQGEEPGYYTAVRQITGKIQESAEYKDMMRTLKSLLTAAVASLSSGVEEEETPGPARQRRSRREPIGSYCTDNDSDSSFNQSYKFCPGKLQLIVDQLDPRQPKEVRLEALQVLCSAPPSDILTCESWTELCGRLTASLPDPDPGFSDRVLKFYAQMFTLLPLHMTKEIYISLMKYLELYFLSRENHIPLSAGVDVTNPNVTRLLKKVRLLSEYQKEAPSLWIRHSEKYMEEIVESTLSLLSVKHDQSHLVSPKILDPIYFFALVDPKAEWFKKWMHAYYSRTTVLKLLEKKYKSLITTAVQQCVQYLELCETMKADEILGHSKRCGDRWKTLYYSRQEVQYVCFIHSLCLLGRLLIYTQGRKLFPIKLKDRKDSVSLTDLLVLFIQLIYCSPSCPNTAPDLYLEDYSPASMVTDILRVLCDQKECAVECLYNSTVISTLLQPVHNLLKGTEGTCGLASLRDEEIGRAQKEQELLLMGSSISGVFQAALDCSETALIHAADILARIASAEEGLALLICEENTNSSSEESPAGAHTLAQFTRRLLDEEISAFSGSALLPVVQGAFLSVCCQIYGTCEGLQALLPYSLHEAVARAWRKTNLPSERIPTPPSGSHSVASVSQGSQNVSSSTRPVSGFREVRRVPKIASTKHTALSGKGSELHGHPHGQVLDVSASFKQVMSAGTKFSSRNVSSTKFDEFQSRQVPSMAWEENLLDDLLNFAATPRGLLLLQRTGVMSECVTFMSNQYARNLQVSRQKKIDYGVLLTQVASTAAGAVALQDSGFVSALVAGLWSSLECGVDDTRVTHPRSAPVDPIDQGCQKSFLALVSLLSSPAVYELLGHQDLPNRAEYSLREVPTCVTAADLLENLGYLSRAAPIHCFISRFLPALLASQTLRSRTSTVECRQVLSGLQAALDQREDIIDRLIVLNSEAKIHSLFNYEQSHIFGLRLLSVMCCDLDTLLLLESQYQVSRVLMCAQEENILETSRGHRSFIIDGLSVERNHVLVRMNLIGGPLERTLPPRTLEKGDNPYPWPMFSSYPLPHCYLLKPARNSDMKQDGDLGTLLSCFTVSDKQNEWIENCQRQFSKMMKAKPGVVSGGALGGLLEKFVLHLTENPSECFFPSVEYTAADAEVQPESLPSVQQLGVRMAVRCVQILALGAAVGSAYEADSMCEAPGHTLPPHSAVNLSAVVCSPVLVCSVISCHSVAMSTKAPKAPRYGKFLSLLKDGAEADLAWVLEHCERFLKLQRAPVRSSLRRYAGHDWFVSSLFLMLSGDREKTLRVLLRFSRLLASAFLWLPRLHLSSCLPADTARSGIPPAYFCGAHCTEMLLKSEVPLVFSAFRMSGFAPSQICLQWITQCFWNYLDWIEICHYIATCVFLGPDYQVYICIAVFKHLQQEILQHTQTQDLQVFLKEEALRGFRVSDYFEYMEMLEQNYRPALLRDMRNISVQST